MSRLFAGTAVALVVWAATPVIAQQAPAPSQGTGSQGTPPPQDSSDQQPPLRSRGNGALFGGADSASRNASRAFALSLSLSRAYDDDLSEGQGTSPLQPLVGGEFSDVSATLAFARNAPRARVGGRASSSLRHYPSLDRFVGSSYSAGTDLSLNVDRRTRLQASVDGTYVSEFAFDTISRQSGLGNAALVSTGLDVTALDGARLSYGAAAGLTRRLGLHSALSLNLGARTSERRMIDEFAAEKTIGGYFARSVGRDTTIGFAYGLRGRSQRLGRRDARPVWGNDLQAGIDHSWRHAADRRTVVSLSVGPSLLQLPPANQASSSTRIGVVGSAALSHDMSRSWNLGTSYRRGAGSIDGLQFDAVAADLHGLLSRRVDLTISAGYSRTDLGLDTGQSRYTTVFGSSRLQVGLTRRLALYGQYVLYDYDIGSAMPLADAAPSRRRGIRTGLTLWTPRYGGR
jgi:hypothetical protein